MHRIIHNKFQYGNFHVSSPTISFEGEVSALGGKYSKEHKRQSLDNKIKSRLFFLEILLMKIIQKILNYVYLVKAVLILKLMLIL